MDVRNPTACPPNRPPARPPMRCRAALRPSSPSVALHPSSRRSWRRTAPWAAPNSLDWTSGPIAVTPVDVAAQAAVQVSTPPTCVRVHTVTHNRRRSPQLPLPVAPSAPRPPPNAKRTCARCSPDGWRDRALARRRRFGSVRAAEGWVSVAGGRRCRGSSTLQCGSDAKDGGGNGDTYHLRRLEPTMHACTRARTHARAHSGELAGALAPMHSRTLTCAGMHECTHATRARAHAHRSDQIGGWAQVRRGVQPDRPSRCPHAAMGARSTRLARSGDRSRTPPARNRDGCDELAGRRRVGTTVRRIRRAHSAPDEASKRPGVPDGVLASARRLAHVSTRSALFECSDPQAIHQPTNANKQTNPERQGASV